MLNKSIQRDGSVLFSVINDFLCTVSGNQLIVSTLHADEITEQLVFGSTIDIENTQLVAFENELFLFDFGKKQLTCINDSFIIRQIPLPDMNFSTNLLVVKKQDSRIVFANSLTFYEYDPLSQCINIVPSVSIMKHHRPLRRTITNLFTLSHDFLCFTSQFDKVIYHFHKEENTIGIYDTLREVKITEFLAPEPIVILVKSDKTRKKTSLIASGFLGNKILLCYQKAFYILDFSGKVLFKRESKNSESTYTGICILNKNEFLVAEETISSGKLFTEIRQIRL